MEMQMKIKRNFVFCIFIKHCLNWNCILLMVRLVMNLYGSARAICTAWGAFKESINVLIFVDFLSKFVHVIAEFSPISINAITGAMKSLLASPG